MSHDFILYIQGPTVSSGTQKATCRLHTQVYTNVPPTS